MGVLFGPDGTVITRFPNGVGVAQYESAYFDRDGVKNADGWPVQTTCGRAPRDAPPVPHSR